MIRKKKNRPKPQATRALHVFAHIIAVVIDLHHKGVYNDLRKHDPVVGSGEPVTIKN